MKQVFPTNYLDEIVRASRGRAMYDDLLVQAVQAARDASISWERIGEALGVTRQAVSERYAKKMRPAPKVGSDSSQWRE